MLNKPTHIAKAVCRIFAQSVLVFLLLATPARADCANPVGAEGDQLYNADYKVMQFCNGTQWIAMLGQALPTCSDGDIVTFSSAAGWECASGGGASSPPVPTDIKVTSAATNGARSGYSGLQSWIESNGCAGYRVCTTNDIVNYLLSGASITTGGQSVAWFAGGLAATEAGGKDINDCVGWTSSGDQIFAPRWNLTSNNPIAAACNTTARVLCCQW